MLESLISRKYEMVVLGLSFSFRVSLEEPFRKISIHPIPVNMKENVSQTKLQEISARNVALKNASTLAWQQIVSNLLPLLHIQGVLTGEKVGSRKSTRQERKQERRWTEGEQPAFSGTLTPSHGWAVSTLPSPSTPDSEGIEVMGEGQRLNCPQHACGTVSSTLSAQRLQMRGLVLPPR